MTSTSIIGSIVSWLSAGYPEGVPPIDRFPLLALLRRTLTEEQVKEVVAKLTDPQSAAQVDGVVSKDEIEKFISDVTKDEPTTQDISRVASRLAAGGWPLAGVDATALNA
ncbi:DUF3349 domain-containing protein [Mycobacteroides franklinii]|uniref:DUF3349 domain-containing protein n=1 Tax=Mycobacteroides franklinii TaxID=948102 RepID=A0A4R5PFX9_9MYCO|nr:DUF3349 domain-containing protein [Mycobacteroides franklinii]ORA59230.1 hypothetical protein BST24_17920 [Mycobacteroides franklinii]TDH24335.1 DUF3349 domain-containing protein [Mycobacteroides franklinii]TDZ43018.1 hypothetical protein CCUG64054_03069 [Mycobacteroides franklinii]TDZ50152.1 hypothetical protein CCUG63697_01654 [Mycobacteroides franklinii]TDZ56573.1 hypothetical protein CCUG63696_03071 [Mycobacteroides franklinii]